MEVDTGISQQEQELPGLPDAHQESIKEESEQGDETMSVAESTEGLPSTSSEDKVKFKLLSPMGGKSIEFTMVKGQANRDVQEELIMHLCNIFKLGLGIKEAFEKSYGVMNWQDLPWSEAEKVPDIIKKLNKCISSVVSLWRGATRPHTESEWFQSPYCNAEQSKKLSFTIFNRVVKNAHVLNKCYKSFSSLTYGETSFDQIQIILDRLKMTDKDVFVDLGSGVGHVVTYASAYAMAKKCIGIEINDLPAEMATKMKKEFEGMMSWYGKKYRPLELMHGDFLDKKFRKLITEEATVIYINNFAFDALLMFNIKQLILEMPNGTRIVCTKSLSEEREEKGEIGEGGRGERKSRPISGRTISRQTVDMMLDCDELPIADAPVSWSTGKGVQFLLFTVNHSKIEQIFQSAKNSDSGSSSTRSGSAESVVVQPVEPDLADRSIAATINEVAASRGNVHGGGGGTRPIKMYDEEDDDDDEEYTVPSSARKWSGLKSAEKRRGGRDDEYVPRKRGSTGASGSKHAKKDKKDRVKKEEVGGATASSSRGSYSSKMPEGGVVLDPTNAMDRHLIELRQSYMDFMTYLTTEEAKRRLMEEYHTQTLRNQELTARIAQMVSTVEQLLNAGVQTLNCRLHELEMTDVTSPADILNRSKQIVTAHKDVTLQVSAMESQVLNLERQIRTTVPYGQALIEKLDSADFSLEDPYGVLISQACAETVTNAEEGEVPVQLPDHLLSPSGGTTATRRPRPRPRANQARRSGGAAGTAAAASGATAPASGQTMPGAAKADNDEVERQIAEIVQKALQVDSVAKEKERRARGAGAASVSGTSGVSGGGSGDRKRSGGGATSTPTAPLPSTPVTSAAGAYGMSAAELLRFQLPAFDQSMDYQQHH